jgi:hypothetical protein
VYNLILRHGNRREHFVTVHCTGIYLELTESSSFCVNLTSFQHLMCISHGMVWRIPMQSLSSVTDSCSGAEEITRFIWYPTVHHGVHNSSQLVIIPSQFNTTHLSILLILFYKMFFENRIFFQLENIIYFGTRQFTTVFIEARNCYLSGANYKRLHFHIAFILAFYRLIFPHTLKYPKFFFNK